MSTFDDALKAANSSFRTAFGQTIIVLPDGATERSVTAIVDYNEVEPMPGMPHGKAVNIQITVDNDAATGLSSAEFDSGLAAVKVPEAIGKAAVTKRLSKIIRQDAGMVTYQVR